MKVRTRYLETNRAVGDAETIQWDLSQNLPITAIEMRFNAERAAVAANTLPLLAEINNLRVIDGSKVYKAAIRGKYLQAMEYGQGHKLPMNITSDNAAETAEQTLMLYFGRYFGDKEFFLQPNMMNNPQLVFTSGITVGGNDYATGTLRVTIIIHTLTSTDLNHRGVLLDKEIIAATIAANAEVRVDMPVDQPWWTLGIFNESATKVPLAPVATILSYELDINNKADTPFEYQATDLVQDNIRDLGVFHVCEEELEDWAINLGFGTVIPNITLETLYCMPYGGLFVPFHHIYRNEALEFNISDHVRLIMVGGGTGGVARVFVSQLAGIDYFG